METLESEIGSMRDLLREAKKELKNETTKRLDIMSSPFSPDIHLLGKKSPC